MKTYEIFRNTSTNVRYFVKDFTGPLWALNIIISELPYCEFGYSWDEYDA